MDKQAQNSLSAYGWFGIVLGASMLAIAVRQGLRTAGGDLLVPIVAGGGAVLLLLVGWLMLTIASFEGTGRWPKWGMLHVWPLVAAVFAFFAMSVALVAVWYYMGGDIERLMLASIPATEPMREALSMMGYMTGILWLVVNLPRMGLRLARSAREYTAMLSDDLSPA